jgi:hypothetical protein
VIRRRKETENKDRMKEGKIEIVLYDKIKVNMMTNY